MSKAQSVLYSVAVLLLFVVAPAIIEGKPLWAIGSVAVAGICVRIAERV